VSNNGCLGALFILSLFVIAALIVLPAWGVGIDDTDTSHLSEDLTTIVQNALAPLCDGGSANLADMAGICP
jgi:hypothetical protein